MFVHIQPVSLAQDGGQCGGAAAEVGFFCCTRSANLRSRTLWMGLNTTAPPGRTDSGICAASLTLARHSKNAKAKIRMIGRLTVC